MKYEDTFLVYAVETLGIIRTAGWESVGLGTDYKTACREAERLSARSGIPHIVMGVYTVFEPEYIPVTRTNYVE